MKFPRFRPIPAPSDHRHRHSSATPTADTGAAVVPVGLAHTETTGSARLPVMWMPDVIAWATAEGFEFWGVVGPK